MNSRRVLIVRVGAMGDVLHTLPAVAALRTMWPDAQLDWVVDPRWTPLLVDGDGHGPLVSRVHLAETRLWSQNPFSGATLRSVMSLRRALRAGRYAQVVDAQGTLRSAVIGKLAAGEDLLGFDDPREELARVFYGRTLQRRGTHVAEQNAALLGEALGVRLEPVAVSLPRNEKAEAWAARMMREVGAGGRFAVLAPSAGWGAKQWPPERFAALAWKLRAAGIAVLVNAANTDDTIGIEVVQRSAGAATLAPCNVAQLVALSRRAAVVVGGDSGPIHLAAALGTPVVALFGPTDPARNGPWGPGPKKVLRSPESTTSYKRVGAMEQGLARIEVDAVIEAARTLVPFS